MLKYYVRLLVVVDDQYNRVYSMFWWTFECPIVSVVLVGDYPSGENKAMIRGTVEFMSSPHCLAFFGDKQTLESHET